MRFVPNRPNRTKQLLRDGSVPFGVLLTTSSARLVEFCAIGGADCIVVDTEQHPFNPEELEGLVRACEISGATPIVRLDGVDQRAIGRYLSFGFEGVFVPSISSAADAQIVVRAAKYPPTGNRGIDLARGAGYGSAMPMIEYVKCANNEILVGVTIETVDGLNELDAILAVEGIDIVNVGPTDLAGSMGYGGDSSHPEVIAAVERIERAVLASGKTLGHAVAYPDQVAAKFDAGAGFLVTSISRLVIGAVDAMLRTVRPPS